MTARTGKSWVGLWLGVMLASIVVVAAVGWHLWSKRLQDGLDALADGRAVIVELGGSAAPPSEPAPTPAPPPAVLLPPPGTGLKAAPAEALTESTPLGPLPKIGADGEKPWQYYSKEFAHKGDEPMISVIVTGLGLNKETTDQALRLPPEISLSFSPYADDAAVWAGSGRALGHEALVDLPMEPADYPAVDPGPYALLSNQSADLNEQRLRWVLTRMSGYVGAVAPAAEHFTQNHAAALAPLQFLAGRGLLLVLPGADSGQQTAPLLEQAGLPYAQADAVLNIGMAQENITTQLLAVERLARAQGHALLVVPASPVLLKELSGWVELIGQKGIILAPVSALARLKFS